MSLLRLRQHTVCCADLTGQGYVAVIIRRATHIRRLVAFTVVSHRGGAHRTERRTPVACQAECGHPRTECS
jgi:hypothetical protein